MRIKVILFFAICLLFIQKSVSQNRNFCIINYFPCTTPPCSSSAAAIDIDYYTIQFSCPAAATAVGNTDCFGNAPSAALPIWLYQWSIGAAADSNTSSINTNASATSINQTLVTGSSAYVDTIFARTKINGNNASGTNVKNGATYPYVLYYLYSPSALTSCTTGTVLTVAGRMKIFQTDALALAFYNSLAAPSGTSQYAAIIFNLAAGTITGNGNLNWVNTGTNVITASSVNVATILTCVNGTCP